MKKSILPIFIVLLAILGSCMPKDTIDPDTPLFELKYKEDYTPTYDELISYYEKIDSASVYARLRMVGMTDVGKPLHLLVISGDQKFTPEEAREAGKAVLFINNGIHPGEPCGIDASLKFAEELVRNVDNLKDVLDRLTICIVPVYNTGGLLNRSAYNRANQVGPTETGFRGNARNLDLNRDWLKADSRNAESINKVFARWNPDLFLDTHTTNGSDHQYSVTLIPTNTDGLPKPMADFQRKTLLPELFKQMEDTPYDLTPYVDWSNNDPASGINMTIESPRFSTGYSRLHTTYGFMTENHVYKSYTDRVESAYHFIKVLAKFGAAHAQELMQTREQAIAESLKSPVYLMNYVTDTTQYEWFHFKGYAAGEYVSSVTGLKRFGYDRSQPFEKKIKYFSFTYATDTIVKPKYYVIPQVWRAAVERLYWNNIQLERLTRDTLMDVKAYYITDVSHPAKPYNGHYFHNKVAVEKRDAKVQFYAGDFMVDVNQPGFAYIIEALEPTADDSFFRWNFFDSMLDRREYYSPWGFEENAQKYLDEHPEFKKEWEEARKTIEKHYDQMGYIYYNTEWSEDTYMRYPVFRVE